MDMLTWIGVLVLVLLAFAAGLVGGAVAANVTVRQTVAADQERLQRMGGALVAARRDVVEAGEILRSVKAGRQ